MIKKLAKVSLLAALVGAITFSNVFLLFNNVHAADARNYRAGRIIDDGVFTNSSSMSVQDIQNFFNSKVTCDTWGQKKLSSGMTRAQWMNSQGIYAPFRCMTDFKENPATGQNNYGKNETPAGAISAAQIIYNYSQQFTINPQVIIATLQKENGIITDDIPQPKQFNEAMGFGCPDNVAPGAPACNPAYGGFSAQIYQAARHFRGFMNNSPGWFVPFTTGNNFIRFSPTSSCGGSTVYIENRSTVALYSYTPYQPNQASLNAQYGGGDGCSAHGNRNFYLFFTDWFGSTIADVSITSSLSITSGHALGLYTRIPTKASFEITNNRGESVNIGGMAVAVRDSQGRNLDYPLQNMVIPPYSRVSYQASQVLPEDTYSFEIVNFSNNVWRSDYPRSYNSNYPRQGSLSVVEMPTQTSDITMDELRSGKDSTISFTVKNNSAAQSVDIGRIAVGVRGPKGENFDLAPDAVMLSPGQTHTYSKVFRPPYQGSYNFFVVNTLNNGLTWESNFPLPESVAVQNKVSAMVRPGFTVTQSLQSSNPDPRTGQSASLSFKIKNFGSASVDLGKIGLAGRDPHGGNVDPVALPVVLAAGEEKTLSFDAPFSRLGNYTYSMISTGDNGKTWWNGPPVESGAIEKDIAFNVRSGFTVTQSVQSSPATLHVGQPTNLSFKIKNFGDISVDLGRVGLSGRNPYGGNVDPGAVNVILAPNEERTISFNSIPTVPGLHNYSMISTGDNGKTWWNGPPVESGAIEKSLSLNVKPSATVIDGVDSTLTSMSTSQSTTLSFTVKNFSANTVDLGKVGLMGRSTSGANVDPGVVPVTLAAGEERVISFVFSSAVKSAYTFSLLGTSNNGVTWNNGPELETSSQHNSIVVNVQ